jgi:inosine/xanthosine triphosphatase
MTLSSAFPASFRMTASLQRALAGAPVRVGTENRAKCAAVRQALASLRGSGASGVSEVEIQILPIAVSSGVSDQPMGFREIVAGARNRARSAFASGDCALAVGIEDGLVRLADGGDEDAERVYNVGCAWLTDGELEGSGFSSAFAYPAGCLEPAIRDQAPIGELFDELWRARRNPEDRAASGSGEGNIGRLTAGRLTRSDYGAQAVVCALVRFLHRDLYD